MKKRRTYFKASRAAAKSETAQKRERDMEVARIRDFLVAVLGLSQKKALEEAYKICPAQ